MSYKIQTLPDLKIIKVTVDGPITYFEKKEAYSEAINELKLNNYNKLLFDVRSIIDSEKRTMGDAIDIFNSIKKHKLPKDVKLAFLSTDHKGQHKYFIILFKIITNIEGCHFISHEEAIEWLCME